MNQANVDALATLLKQSALGDLADPGFSDLVAKELASRGVLVPSALTGLESAQVVHDTRIVHESGATEPVVTAVFIAGLERIAKGES